MIHADSVRQWEAESNDLRTIIGNQRQEIERLRTSSTLAEVERLTRERDALRAAVLGLLEYWHEDDMDQEYYEIAEKQALAALEQTEQENPQIETPSAFEHTPGTGSVR